MSCNEFQDVSVGGGGVNALQVQLDFFKFAEDAGATDAYAINLVPPVLAYVKGANYYFKANTANTGPATLAVNGLAPIPLKKNFNAALVTGDILAGMYVQVEYDGTNFQLMSPTVAAVPVTAHSSLTNLDYSTALHTGFASQVAVQNASFIYAEDAGGSDAYAIILVPAIAAYATGQIFGFKANTANTGACTLDVNGKGPIAIKKQFNADLETGDILAGQRVLVIYDGTNFQMLSPVASALDAADIGVSVEAYNANILVSGNIGVTVAGVSAIQNASYIYAADTGIADALVITLSPVPAGYVTGMKVLVKVAITNTGAATLNVNALGPIAIKKNYNQALVAGDIVANMLIALEYDGTNFQLLSPTVNLLKTGDIGSSVQAYDSTTTKNAAVQTLTNKRITLRVQSEISNATPTPDIDSYDDYQLTALAAPATFAIPAGTPTNHQKLLIRIKDDGTARAIDFNAIYRFSTDLAKPTTTVLGKTLYLGFIYNSADTKWDNIAQLNNF
jgi:hypothetical protein